MKISEILHLLVNASAQLQWYFNKMLSRIEIIELKGNDNVFPLGW